MIIYDTQMEQVQIRFSFLLLMQLLTLTVAYFKCDVTLRSILLLKYSVLCDTVLSSSGNKMLPHLKHNSKYSIETDSDRLFIQSFLLQNYSLKSHHHLFFLLLQLRTSHTASLPTCGTCSSGIQQFNIYIL